MGEAWVEAIRVRSSANALKKVATILKNEIKEINEAITVGKVSVMQHALYDGDLTVFIIWSEEVRPEKTREGLILAERLVALGPIDHAVWIPING